MTKKQTITKDHGGTGPVIILLHGFLADKSYWQKLQPHLTRAGYRVIIIDLLGFGAAKNLHASRYDYAEHLDHIHKQITTLQLEGPFILVGHSMGALLGARYASDYPAVVRSLFLLHPPLYKDRAEVQQTLRATSRFYRFLLDSQFREFGWRLLQYIPKIPIGSHTLQAREGSLHNVIERAEFIPDLHTITVKTILLIGSKDRPEYIKNITSVNKLGTHIEVIIDNVSHHSPLYNARTIAQLIIKSQKLTS